MAVILVVDDEPVLRRNIAKYLGTVGHAVHIAEDGHKALELVNAANVDLVITDVNMPGMDGLELLSILENRTPPVPAILMSGGSVRLSKDDASRPSGSVVRLQKPFSFADLLSAVQGALGE